MPIIHQSTNSIQTSADGVDFVTDNETLIIDPGVLVESKGGFGVYSDYANSTLINHGFIESTASFYAVWLGTGNTDLFNAAGATIFAPNGVAVEIADSAETGGSHIVTNRGDIIGADGIIFHPDADGSLIVNNYGNIQATEGSGVVSDSDVAGATINNFHTIIGNNDGINDAVKVFTAPGLLTDVYNAGGALIEGGIVVDGGRLHFENHGAVLGDIRVKDAEKAVIINAGQIFGDVHLGKGGGNDYFDGTGGTI
jgi:hypothetical protein